MYSRKFSVAAIAAIVMAAGAGSAYAQVDQGELVGAVRDATGAVIPESAKVTATNVDTRVNYTAVTTGAGEYRIPNLPNGNYDVTTTVPGFAPNTLKGVGITANNVQTQDFTLGTAGQSTTVEVQSQAAVAIDTTTAQISSTFSQKEARDLPSATVRARRPQPRCLRPAQSARAASAPAPALRSAVSVHATTILKSTVSTTTARVSPAPKLNVPNDAVGQFVLLENVYSAQYGHSTGGQFDTIITTGTNSVHGGVYEYFQNRNLNAVGTNLQGTRRTWPAAWLPTSSRALTSTGTAARWADPSSRSVFSPLPITSARA